MDNFTPIPQAPDFKSISGDVQGLTGVLTLGWESRTQVLTGGAFTIPLAFDSGADFVLSIVNEPFSQTCTIDSQTVFNAQDVDVVGVSISCTKDRRRSQNCLPSGSNIRVLPIVDL